MPLFYYTAVSEKGERKNGTQEAADTSALAKTLRDQGFILTSVKAKNEAKAAGFNWRKFTDAFKIFNRVSLEDKMMFARHLSVMVKAGFSLNKALQVLILQTKNQRFAKVIKEMEEEVRKGTSFGDALSRYPDVFSDLFVNMVRVGETAGNLEENLRLLAVQMKKDHNLLSRIKSAMMYPAVILVAMFGIGVIMMIFVMPKLISIFSDLNVELPLPTRIVIGLTNFLIHQWYLAIGILAALVIFGRLFWRSKNGKEIMDSLFLRLPIFGNIVKKVNCARMARTLSSLIESGVPIVRALEITSGTLGSNPFKKSMLEAAQHVQKGEPLNGALSSHPDLFLPLVIQMVQVGEETGTLGDITVKLAEFYEEEVSTVTRSLSTIIEPILMIVMGAAVGFFAVSMIQPMYSMMNSI